MKPQDELEYLKNFIQLTPEQVIKRDMLNEFLNNNKKILLLDADSILYKVVNFWMDKEEDLEEMYEDFHSQVREMVNTIEDDGFNIVNIQYYFTKCRNNFRKEIYSEYKANRKDNPLRKLAIKLMDHCIDTLETTGMYVDYSDTLEADDAISIYVKTYGHKDIITCSIDKDLKQIHGAHFDYLKVKTDKLDAYQEPIKEYKGWRYTTPSESVDLFLKQMLEGDTGDNIKGVNGVGKVGAAKLLEGKTNYGKLLAVARAYRIYCINENGWFYGTEKQYNKHKGEKEWNNNMERMRLNCELMRL